MSSLVILKGSKGADDEHKVDRAKLAGVKFIPLVWNGTCPKDLKPTAGGFRSVEIGRPLKNGKNLLAASFSKDNETGEPCANHHLVFESDEFAVGTAMLPDDPDGFNRRVLAAHSMGPVKIFSIADPAIEKEIEGLAETMKLDPEFIAGNAEIERIRMSERIRRETEAKQGDKGELGPYEADNAVMEAKLREIRSKRRNEELRRELAKELGEENLPPAPAREPVAVPPPKIVNEPEKTDHAKLFEELKTSTEKTSPALKPKGAQSVNSKSGDGNQRGLPA